MGVGAAKARVLRHLTGRMAKTGWGGAMRGRRAELPRCKWAGRETGVENGRFVAAQNVAVAGVIYASAGLARASAIWGRVNDALVAALG